MIEADLRATSFISILYCQVPPSKNKVDYYYYLHVLFGGDRSKVIRDQ